MPPPIVKQTNMINSFWNRPKIRSKSQLCCANRKENVASVRTINPALDGADGGGGGSSGGGGVSGPTGAADGGLGKGKASGRGVDDEPGAVHVCSLSYANEME